MNVYQTSKKWQPVQGDGRSIPGRDFVLCDIFAYVERFQGLKSLGIKARRQDYLYSRYPQWLSAGFHSKKGAVAVPIAPIYTPRDLRYIAGDSGRAPYMRESNSWLCQRAERGRRPELSCYKECRSFATVKWLKQGFRQDT